MKITALNTQIVDLNFRNCVIVELETDAGISGISETVMKRKTRTIEQSIVQMRNFLLGKDPTEIESLWEQTYRDSFWVGGPMHATAISAIDCTLWDILAKRCNVPVNKLHGGPTRTEVLVYCHCASGSRPEEFAQNVKECAARGYEAVKDNASALLRARHSGAAGYSGTCGAVDRHWKETEYLDPGIFRAIREFFVAAREAGGPHLGIAVDCHGRLGVKQRCGCAGPWKIWI